MTANAWTKINDETAVEPGNASAFLISSLYRNSVNLAKSLPRTAGHSYGGYYAGTNCEPPPSWSCHPACPTGHFYCFDCGPAGADSVRLAVTYSTVNAALGGMLVFVHVNSGVRAVATAAGTATPTVIDVELTGFPAGVYGLQWFWIGWIPDESDDASASGYILSGVGASVYYEGEFAGRMNHMLRWDSASNPVAGAQSLFVGWSRNAPDIAAQVGLSYVSAFEVFPALPTSPTVLNVDPVEYSSVKTDGSLYELGMVTVYNVGAYAETGGAISDTRGPMAHTGVAASGMQTLQGRQLVAAGAYSQPMAMAPPPSKYGGAHPCSIGTGVGVSGRWMFDAVDEYATILAQLSAYTLDVRSPDDGLPFTLGLYAMDGTLLSEVAGDLGVWALSFVTQPGLARAFPDESVGLGNMQHFAQDWGMGWSSALFDARRVVSVVLRSPGGTPLVVGDTYTIRLTVPDGNGNTWLHGCGVTVTPSPVRTE